MNLIDTKQQGYDPNHHMNNTHIITSDNTTNTGTIGTRQSSNIHHMINDDDIVPTVFKWDNGGRNVYITGTFNNWEKQIPMHRSGNEFSYVHNLSRGKHAYKFIVDDEWRFAPDQPTVADVEGRINNFIDVSEFCPYVGDASKYDIPFILLLLYSS